ncbi:MAG TPA: hypothetical protein VN581_08625 [Patescibacteria group bacterium]|nr:hypothetical protein [Patescibacteria group bacterium]
MDSMLKRRLGVLFGLMTAAMAASAVEWTDTIDRHATVTGTIPLVGELAATDEALWIGPGRAFDPTTGADLSPYALPERLSLVDLQYGVSSQRGPLWKTYFFFDFMPHYQPDAVEGFWGMAGTGTTEAVYLAKDGAQLRRWTAANFGRPEMHVIAVNPLLEEAGAMVLIGNTAAALALQIDRRGKLVRATSVPACSNSLADDRHGGLYVLCPSAGDVSGELHHLGAIEAERWSRRVGQAELTRSGIGADGGVLVHESMSPGDDLWQSLDRQGNHRMSVPARSGIAFDDGFWFLGGSGKLLSHYRPDGHPMATISAVSISTFAVHSDGALIARGQFNPNRPDDVSYRLISGSGVKLRELDDAQTDAGDRSRIDFWSDSTIPVMAVAEGTVLIDDRGEPASAPFNSSFTTPGRLMADARTLCMSRVPSVIDATLGTECFDRQTGQRLLEPTYSGDVLNIDGDILSLSSTAFEWRTREGAMIRGVSREGELAWDFHPTQGLALLRRIDASTRLQRYRNDGTLIFDVLAPQVSGEAIVGLGSDGSSLVAGKQSPSTLLRYDADGNLRAMRTIELSRPEVLLVAASSSSDSVLLLQRSADNRAGYRGQVTVLDDRLQRRGEYAFADAISPRFQPARAGAARFLHATPSGLMVLQFDPATGAPSERRALPIQNTGGRFAIDLDGVVRAMSFDPELGRDVLRISRPAPSTFAGPIRQSALAGAWFNPASTGQGLLLQLLNGNVLFGAWHTFAPEGGNALSKQQWFTVSAELTRERGRVTLPIYRNADGRFDTDGVTPAEAVGSAELVFTSCDQLEFWYRLGEDAGVFPLQRLTPRTRTCDDGTTMQPAMNAPTGLALDGAWFDPDQSGQGFTFNSTGARFGSFLAGWFTYDTDGNVDDDSAQHWFTLQGAIPEQYGQAVPALIHRTIGGSRAGAPTRNTHAVGNALLTVHDCAHATLSYVFDDSIVAGAFANRHRSVQLQRLGACVD